MTEPSQIWRYDGEWSKIADPVDWESSPTTETSTTLQAAGFTPASSWGTLRDIEIYEHKEGERWRILWSVDASRIHEIEVLGLPHLIKLLSDLGTVALAELLSRTEELLEDAIFNLAEDGKRERNRRFPKKG